MAVMTQGLYIYFLTIDSRMAMAFSFGISFILVIYYFVWPTSEWGQTFGKKLIGIRVVSIESGDDISLLTSFVRQVFALPLSVFFLGLGLTFSFFSS